MVLNDFREQEEKIYNSNLFSPHPFEKWGEFTGATEKVIDILYGDKNYFEYAYGQKNEMTYMKKPSTRKRKRKLYKD